MRLVAAITLWTVAWPPLQAQSIEQFFEDFTAEWVRGDPNLASRTTYFEGEEQDQLDRRLTPVTREYALERVALAKRGLEQLRKFDRAEMTDVQRVSAEVMEWQLRAIVDGEAFLDFDLPPLNQFRGANTVVPNVLLNFHRLASARAAENYVARLAEVDDRMDEAIAEARRLERKGILPPRFILDATRQQMLRFSDSSPGQSPLVTNLARKTEGPGGAKRGSSLAAVGQGRIAGGEGSVSRLAPGRRPARIANGQGD